MKKSIRIIITATAIFVTHNCLSQQIIRASDNVQIVTTAGTKTMITGGGITFLGVSKWTATADSIYLIKTTATATEGWLDSTATGAMDAASTGNVFIQGTYRQSFYGKTRFYDLTIRNTVGDTLLSSCEVRNILRLDTGFISTRRGYGNDSLWVSNTATTAIVSNTTTPFSHSWINGRLSRTGNVVGTPAANFYLFPLGQSDSLYAPIKLAKVNTTTATWTAEYNYAIPFNRTIIQNPPIDHISEVEYWEITSNNQASTDDDAKLSLSWRGRSYVSGTSTIRDSLIVAQYIDNIGFRWEVPGNWAPPGQSSGADSLFGYVTSFAATNQYSYDERRFTLGTISRWNALPAKLLYFTAIANGDRVRLKWEAANEFETERYEIEKSLNGTSFSFLTSTRSRLMTQSAYTNFDFNPFMGWNYYRLKVIDKSGSFFYSPIMPVKIEKGLEAVKFFPVPASTFLNIQLPTSYINQTTLQVIAVDGKFIGTLKPTANMVVLNVAPLAAGTYFIQILKNDGNQETYRFVKQ